MLPGRRFGAQRPRNCYVAEATAAVSCARQNDTAPPKQTKNTKKTDRRDADARRGPGQAKPWDRSLRTPAL